MGRLTLNVLLSFAQFERELASERVRDKLAALTRYSSGIIRFPCATASRNNHRHRLRQPSRSYIVGASISSNAFKGNCG
jgi:DNA invertase Pin-like site-specific DNA recombinase